jgi:hypothetical protein
MITSSFLKIFQRRKLEGATSTNGFFLQKETVLQMKQDLIDYVYNNLYLGRKQANYLLFLKKMGDPYLNVQKRNVTQTISETILYGKIFGFVMLFRCRSPLLKIIS